MESNKLSTDLVSIIIPSFNRGKLIGETILSIKDQTYNNWELIIVDDGSTDNTFEIVEPFLSDSRIKIFSRPKIRPSGGNAARNYGLELSKGKLIKWLDSDDLLKPDCLLKQIDFLNKSNSDVVFCRSQYFTENKITRSKELGSFWNDGFKIKGELLENFILGRVRFSNNDGLWRKSILGKKPYNEILKNSQEYLMIISMLSKRISVSLNDEVLILIRKHEDQMPSKRSYSSYVHNQTLCRYLVIKELKERGISNLSIYNYLIKSIIYYNFSQIKKNNFENIASNLKLIIKSFYLSYKF